MWCHVVPDAVSHSLHMSRRCRKTPRHSVVSKRYIPYIDTLISIYVLFTNIIVMLFYFIFALTLLLSVQNLLCDFFISLYKFLIQYQRNKSDVFGEYWYLHFQTQSTQSNAFNRELQWIYRESRLFFWFFLQKFLTVHLSVRVL